MSVFDVNISVQAPVDAMRTQLEALSLEVARRWFAIQTQNQFEHYHLYYRPSSIEAPGQLSVSAEKPAGFELANTERLSPAWTIERAQSFIYRAIQTLPILTRHQKEECGGEGVNV